METGFILASIFLFMLGGVIIQQKGRFSTVFKFCVNIMTIYGLILFLIRLE